MAITINGTSGISGVDGSAATPALQGSDTNTGISFGTDEVNINTGGSTRATVDSSGNLQFNSGYGSVATAYGCRAWINFDGAAGTIGTGRGSANMDAVTDNGTGDYTVNFTNDMPDANYAVLTSVQFFTNFGIDDSTAPTTGAVRLLSRNPSNNTDLERNFYFVAIVR